MKEPYTMVQLHLFCGSHVEQPMFMLETGHMTVFFPAVPSQFPTK